MENITLNLQGSFIEENELKEIKPEIMAAQEMLLDRKGASSEMTGWLDCMYRMDKKELEDIKRAGRYIQENSQAFTKIFKISSLSLPKVIFVVSII
jgi:glucose-6-phosphate isomerase